MRGRLGAAAHPELAEHAADVVLGRLRRDDQAFGDLAVRQAGDDQVEHLALAHGELVALAAAGTAPAGPELAQERGGLVRVAPGATAFGHRGAGGFTWIIGASDGSVDPVAEWARGVWRDTAPFATGGVYVNALEPDQSVREAFADGVWERLVAIKRRYDPDGVFAGNGIAG